MWGENLRSTESANTAAGAGAKWLYWSKRCGPNSPLPALRAISHSGNLRFVGHDSDESEAVTINDRAREHSRRHRGGHAVAQ